MKKMFLFVAVAASAAMFCSCGSNAETKAGKEDGEALKAKIENCTDPDSLKLYVEQAREYAARLEADGKGDEAKAYINELIPAVKEKDASALSVFDQLKEKASEEIDNAREAGDSLASKVAGAAGDLKEKASDAVEAGKNKAGEVVNSGKEKAANAIDKGKEKASNAVDKGKEKVSDAAQKGADKVKDLLNK